MSATQIPRTVAQLVPGGPAGQAAADARAALGVGTGGGSAAGDLLSALALPEATIAGAATLDASHLGKWHRCTGTAGYAVALPAAAGNAGKLIGFRLPASTTALVALQAGAGDSIDGAGSRVMRGGESAVLLCDGSGWAKVAGRSVPMRARVRRANGSNPNAAQAISGEAATKILFNQADVDNTGLMADLANSRLICRRAGGYRVNSQGLFSALAADHSILSTKLYVNGANVGDANFSALAGAYASVPFRDEVVLAEGDAIELLVYINVSSENLYGNTTGGSSFLDLIESAPW